MHLVLLSFKDDHGDVGVLLGLGKLLLDLAHELHVDVDVLIGLQLALHGGDGEHLLGLRLLHAEVKANWVLALILQIEWQLFRLTDSHGTEVELRHHALVE